jgi:hypothetical protein
MSGKGKQHEDVQLHDYILIIMYVTKLSLLLCLLFTGISFFKKI